MTEIKSYRDLMVWQKSKSLCIAVYQNTQNFPKSEMYGLQSQIRRSAVSVPSNIAEGSSRYYSDDFPRFLRMALGSLFELQTQLEISVDLKYIPNDTFLELQEFCLEVEKMLNSLINKVVQSKK
jgi:four helix bundle protein